MKPFRSNSLDAMGTYMYGLKSRAQRHHCLGNGMFPVEMTRLMTMRKHYSKSIRPVTLTAILVKAVALTVRKHAAARRILFQRFPLRRRIVEFDVVDVNVPISRDVDGKPVLFIGVVRGADGLAIADIQDELTRLQRQPPAESPNLSKLASMQKAPRFAISLYHWLMSRSPAFYLRNAGTCGMTALDGMTGSHFFPIGPITAVFGIGGIGDQVVARDGMPVVRKMLNVALTLDNYVINGVEGLELARTFQELVESCSFVAQELQDDIDE